MITVHHLNNSRSQRILWLLEELEVANRAPAELKAIHPLGKSPVIEDGDDIVAETGAIIVYILDKYGKGKFLGEAAAPIQPMIMNEIKGVLDYCEYRLIRHEYFAGDVMTGADITMIFPLEAAKARGRLKGYEACNEFVDKIHKRPAYLRALEKGGDYAYGPK